MARDSMDLSLMGRQARKNSERWFPDIHSMDRAAMPIDVHYGLALAGEVGELANILKKCHRYNNKVETLDEMLAKIPGELADIFTYLLLLADEFQVDLLEAFEDKQVVCEQRWG